MQVCWVGARAARAAERATDTSHPKARRCCACAQSKPSKAMSYTNYFADALVAEAKADSRIMAIHAAMAGGTGLTR